MTVIVLARVTAALRGKLTRWMLEVHPGVFVGTLSPRVRDRLWSLSTGSLRQGACTMVVRAPNEQGFALQVAGDPRRGVADYDGLQLVRRPARGRRKSRAGTGP